MRQLSVGFAMLLTLLAFNVQTARAEDKWEKLGERKVDYRAEKDTIEVGSHDGKFSHIRFRVAEGDIELYKIKVVFADGQTYEPETGHHFKEGDRTHEIELPGKARHVDKVEFYYKSEHHEPAVVELLGKRAD
jgi:hypothetical protein